MVDKMKDEKFVARDTILRHLSLQYTIIHVQ